VTDAIAAYLEVGSKRVFAGALDWPGWCRSGRTEDDARAALVSYAGRYAKIVEGVRPRFPGAASADEIEIVERLEGDATTDFGAPGATPEADARPIGRADRARLLGILDACWWAFERVVAAADGRELAKGPRGGGRSVEKIVEHVIGAEGGYIRMIGRTLDASGLGIPAVAAALRAEVEIAIRDGVPPSARGGKRRPVRYYIRRSAWHLLDHAWEIEDRMPGPAASRSAASERRGS